VAEAVAVASRTSRKRIQTCRSIFIQTEVWPETFQSMQSGAPTHEEKANGNSLEGVMTAVMAAAAAAPTVIPMTALMLAEAAAAAAAAVACPNEVAATVTVTVTVTTATETSTLDPTDLQDTNLPQTGRGGLQNECSGTTLRLHSGRNRSGMDQRRGRWLPRSVHRWTMSTMTTMV